MNEYLLKLYDWVSSKDASFSSKMTKETFIQRMENEPEYNNKMHTWISKKDPKFNTRLPLNEFQKKTLKKKDTLDSDSEVGLSEPTKVYDPISGELLGEVKEDNPLFAKKEGFDDFYKSQEDDVDIYKDVNIQTAIDNGLISDEELILAGYKQPGKISTISTPSELDKEKAKNKILAYRSKTKNEISSILDQEKLNSPYAYVDSSSEDSFVEDVFGTTDLALMNINPKDFDGFLEKKGYKKDFKNKEKNNLFDSSYMTLADPKLSLEIEKARMLNLYISEQVNRDIKYQKLIEERDTGINPDNTGRKYNFRPSQSNVKLDVLDSYVQKNMPILTKKLNEVQAKNKTLYKEYMEGGMSIGTLASSMSDAASIGVRDRINQMSASAYDLLSKTGIDYFSNVSESIRLQMDQDTLSDFDPSTYGYVSGRRVEVNGRNYLVDESDQIYDLDIKKRVTSFLDANITKEILNKSIEEGVEDSSYSTAGVAIQTSNVVGDMLVQIALTKGAASGMSRAGALTEGFGILSKTKDVLRAIPMSRGVSASMIAQGTMGLSSGYEQTLKLAKDNGLNENEARELAQSASIQMGVLYTLTAPISPQTKATEAIFGKIKNETIKNAVDAYIKVGKKGFVKTFQDAGKKVLNYSGEGVKEVFQENIQQTGEMMVVNKNINDQAGRKIAKDTITGDDFINTTILSFTAGFLMPGAGSALTSARRKARDIMGLSGVDRMKSLDYLVRNEDKLNSLLESQIKKGVYTQEDVDNLKSEIKTYKDGVGKIPKNLKPKVALEVMSDIAKIRDLESERKQLDPAFHQEIDDKINNIREEIKKKTSKVEETKEEVLEETKEEPFITEKKKEKLEDALDRPITLTELGGSKLDTPIEGDLYVEGQQVVVEDADGRITEIGNVNEVSGSTLEELGIVPVESEVKTDNEGNIVFNGETLVPEVSGIKRNKKGNISRVVLRNSDGSITRTLRGSNAEDAAYQILLKEATSPEQEQRINEILEQNEEFQNEFRETTDTTKSETTKIPEGNRLRTEPLEDAKTIAEQFTGGKGTDTGTTENFEPLVEERSKEMADVYDKAEATPNDKKTIESYRALAKETIDQFKAILKAGYKVTMSSTNSYKSSSDMIEDLKENKRMFIFPTKDGFGSKEITPDQVKENILLEDSGFKDSEGNPMLINDVFRFVHDFFGHAKAGNSFGPKGEEIAWQVHSKMYSPKARRAMTTETRGQNSWVNFSGANDAAFKLRDEARALRKKAESTKDVNEKKKLLEEALAKVEQAYENMKFADQKMFLIPDKYVFPSENDSKVEETKSNKKEGISATEIRERSEKNIKNRVKKKSLKERTRIIREKFLDRQTRIKDVLKGINSKQAKAALAKIVTKAGASGYANFRFKEADKKIYKNLSTSDKNTLDEIIYASRIISINKNRRSQGKEEYKGIEGYNDNNAQRDLDNIKDKVGDKKFNDLMSRSKEYFKVFDASLKRMFEADLISEEVYEQLRDLDYSPIKTIKYILPENSNVEEIDRVALTTGVTKDAIKSLSDENVNDIVTDTRWLLQTNLSMIEATIFENRMLNAFNDAISQATDEEKKAINEIILDNPIVGNYKDGRPKRKYDEKYDNINYKKVFFKKDGVSDYMVVSKVHAEQLLDVKTKPGITSKVIQVGSGTNVLRFFATAGNPLFIVGNTAVDFQNILFLSDTYSKNKFVGGVELAADFVKNTISKMVSTNSYKKTYEEYMIHGGSIDYLATDGLKSLESLKPAKKILKVPVSTMKAIGKTLSYLGETSEISFRIAVYEKSKSNQIKAFKKNNNNREPNADEMEEIMFEATREARETIDFSQGGSATKAADKVLPYLNASTQGFRKAIDYANDNPVGFASSMIQASLMSGGMMAGSLFLLMRGLDDDDDIEEVLNRVSDYEKSNYHIFFTGKKDEDGEYEYYRVRKLPTISVFSTLAEQLVIKAALKSKGVDYDINGEVMEKSLLNALPIIPKPTAILQRNPLLSGLITYNTNYDMFYDQPVFVGPRGKKIAPEAEGLYDPKVNNIYKDFGAATGMSPKRSKAFLEKIITSETTNPVVGLIYSGYDAFTGKTEPGKEITSALENMFNNVSKKVKRKTNKNLPVYKSRAEDELEETRIETEIYKKEQEVYNLIKKNHKENKTLSKEELKQIVTEKFDKIDHKKYLRKYMILNNKKGVDREILDIVYEDTPEVQALLIFNKFGDSFEDEEENKIRSVFKAARRRFSKKAMYIYDKKYKKK